MRILKIIAISFGVTSLVLTNISASQAIPVEDLFKAVFSGKTEANPIYAVKSNGDMLFYKHTGGDNGSATWPKE